MRRRVWSLPQVPVPCCCRGVTAVAAAGAAAAAGCGSGERGGVRGTQQAPPEPASSLTMFSELLQSAVHSAVGIRENATPDMAKKVPGLLE
jgi:hypothetical protein